VAPVYQPLSQTGVRDGIYLPAGDWVDYWNQGSITTGPIAIDGYEAPLDTLPLFVQAGAIIPMWPEMQYPGEKPVDPLTLDIFPQGTTSFELYEDDGITRQALEGSAYAKTNIACSAKADALAKGGEVKVVVGASAGNFDGQLSSRTYDIRVHAPHAPFDVVFESNAADVNAGATSLSQMNSLAELDYAESGWFFVKGFTGSHKGGVVVVKTTKIPVIESFSVTLTVGPHVPHIVVKSCDTSISDSQAFDFSQTSGQITLRSNSSACLSVGVDKDPGSGTPALEILGCDANSEQQWVFDSGRLKLTSGAHGCVDLDGSNHHAEMYSCGSTLRDNQHWMYDTTTGYITNAGDGTCMTAEFITAASSTVALV